jgi:hypothetical protein
MVIELEINRETISSGPEDAILHMHADRNSRQEGIAFCLFLTVATSEGFTRYFGVASNGTGDVSGSHRSNKVGRSGTVVPKKRRLDFNLL